jgi:hypothetical protein
MYGTGLVERQMLEHEPGGGRCSLEHLPDIRQPGSSIDDRIGWAIQVEENIGAGPIYRTALTCGRTPVLWSIRSNESTRSKPPARHYQRLTRNYQKSYQNVLREKKNRRNFNALREFQEIGVP